jgi:hypothetical protein
MKHNIGNLVYDGTSIGWIIEVGRSGYYHIEFCNNQKGWYSGEAVSLLVEALKSKLNK